MKQFSFRCLQSLMAVTLCFIMVVAFNSCSSDDDEKSANDDLTSIVVGTWVQDGDDDIFVFDADGTGVSYESLRDYIVNDVASHFKWGCKNGWLCVNFDNGWGNINARVRFLSKDKVVWQDYDEWYSSQSGYEHDAFGYYRLWTWERIIR